MAILTAAALAALPLALPDPPASDFAYRSFRTWKYELPADAYRLISGSIPIAHAGGDGFLVEGRSTGIQVDTDGDGVAESLIEGREDPETKVRHARVTLEGRRADGSALRYTVRLQQSDTGWSWAPGGAMVGEVDGTKLTLIDLNGNGRYDDFGADAMVVGSRRIAQFLSETVAIDGELAQLTVAGDGSSVAAAPYDGPQGVLDFRSELETHGKLLSAIVLSEDGRHSFDLASSLDGVAVPAGNYTVVRGRLGLGAATVDVDPGAMDGLAVAVEQTTVLDWGGPVRAEFEYDRSGDNIVFSPDRVWYIGAAGEQYSDWNPIGKSPEFRVLERDAGTELLKAVFPGSC